MTVTRSIAIAEVLRGCTPGRIQTVGFMQVIPLTSDLHFDNFASPNQAYVSTTHYGTLEFDNQEDEDIIIPSHAAYLVKQAAQNHAMMHAGIAKSKTKTKFDTAACIQDSQSNLISKGQHNLIVLPFTLRETAHKQRATLGYEKLWPAIKKLNKLAGAGNTGGHLEYFLNHYTEELDQFVAEFEPIENQIGAIILVSGKVVGIERTPNPNFWLSMWKPLIRECYGSLAILESKTFDGSPPVPPTRVTLPNRIDTLDALEEALNKVDEEEYSRVKDVVNLICENVLALTETKISGNKRVETLGDENDPICQFLGQVIRQDESIVYGSLIATEVWLKNEDWFSAKPFAM